MKIGLPLDREAFTTYIASTLAQEPGTEILSQEPLSLRLRANGVEGQMNLDNAYMQYCTSPQTLDRLAAVLVSQAQSAAQAMRTPDLTDIAESLYPQIKPHSYIEAIRAQGIPPLIARPFIADLMITFVIDRPDSMIPINARHMEAWQIDEPTLYQMAMSNLSQRKTEYMIGGEGEMQLFFCQSGDGYDAARILLTDLLDEWAESIHPRRLILGLPNRDFLIGLSDASLETVRQVAEQIRRDVSARPYGLTDRLFVWENGVLREYTM